MIARRKRRRNKRKMKNALKLKWSPFKLILVCFLFRQISIVFYQYSVAVFVVFLSFFLCVIYFSFLYLVDHSLFCEFVLLFFSFFHFAFSFIFNLRMVLFRSLFLSFSIMRVKKQKTREFFSMIQSNSLEETILIILCISSELSRKIMILIHKTISFFIF